MRVSIMIPLCATMFLTGCSYMQSAGEMFSADKALSALNISPALCI